MAQVHLRISQTKEALPSDWHTDEILGKTREYLFDLDCEQIDKYRYRLSVPKDAQNLATHLSESFLEAHKEPKTFSDILTFRKVNKVSSEMYLHLYSFRIWFNLVPLCDSFLFP